MFAFRKLCTDKHFRQQLAALRHFKTKIPIDAFKGKQKGAEKKVVFKKQADKPQTFPEILEANFARKQGQDGYAYVALMASIGTITAGEIMRKMFPPNDRSAHTVVVENEPKTENTTDDKTLPEKIVDSIDSSLITFVDPALISPLISMMSNDEGSCPWKTTTF